MINKLFLNNNRNGTVSKFPPVIEFLAQRVQSQFSNYVHEDLSRPPAWDSPVYTLAPDDPLHEELNQNTYNAVDSNDDNATDLEATTLYLLFEIINNKSEVGLEFAANRPEYLPDKNDYVEEPEDEEGTPAPLLFEIINKNGNEIQNNIPPEKISNTIVITNGSITFNDGYVHGNTVVETSITLGKKIEN